MTKSTNYLPNHTHTNNVNDGGNLDNSTQINGIPLMGLILMGGL